MATLSPGEIILYLETVRLVLSTMESLKQAAQRVSPEYLLV
jgi:hypothetical protein